MWVHWEENTTEKTVYKQEMIARQEGEEEYNTR